MFKSEIKVPKKLKKNRFLDDILEINPGTIQPEQNEK